VDFLRVSVMAIEEMLGWLGSAFAIVGSFLNARQKRVGFLFYIISNIILIFVGFSKVEWYNVALFSVFLAISIYGYVVWGRKRGNGGI